MDPMHTEEIVYILHSSAFTSIYQHASSFFSSSSTFLPSTPWVINTTTVLTPYTIITAPHHHHCQRHHHNRTDCSRVVFPQNLPAFILSAGAATSISWRF
mmetsp:Transcript_33417/g.67443  ORF Transcript_33417/g.67443 Transcript_33417/m.67443 type:complete len:100 (+) Transcript_33417:253-552(+)